MGMQWEPKVIDSRLMNTGAELLVQMVKYLPCKHEELSSIPRNSFKDCGVCRHLFIISIMGRQR